jgi:hypothetical protein
MRVITVHTDFAIAIIAWPRFGLPKNIFIDEFLAVATLGEFHFEKKNFQNFFSVNGGAP